MSGIAPALRGGAMWMPRLVFAWFAFSLTPAWAGCSGDDDAEAGSGRGDDVFGNADGQTGPGDGGLPPGACGANCEHAATGVDTDQPFDLDGNPSEHVGLDPDGALILERGGGSTDGLIWIANTRQGTVSKVDTNTFTELGRYEVPIDWDLRSDENGPSRTSVDSDGNVYAGARFGSAITKISALGSRCADANGDGQVTTSSGPGDLLALGEDDCLLWTTDIGGDARGVAVQEFPSKFDISEGPDEETVITEIPGRRYVWTGGQEVRKLHKLDAETGEILLTIDAPVPVYGLALDGLANLWISGREWEGGGQRGAIARVDTKRCVDDSCAAEQVCAAQCSETSCPDSCDGAVLARLELDWQSYGITVDCAQRVWLGGAHGGDGVARLDPLAAADQRLRIVREVAGSDDQGVHGIAADANGWVWGGARDLGVWRIHADTLDFVQVAGTGGPDFSAKGMAVDRRGRVWAVPYRLDYAMVITPGATIDDATVEKPIAGFEGPYTYSDMTGEQRRLAANDPGSYRQRFEGCAGPKPTVWRDLSWDVEVPDGTFVLFLARTADTEAELERAPWFQIASTPGHKDPIAIGPFISGAMQTPGRLLEIDVRLYVREQIEIDAPRDRCAAVAEPGMVTPRVKSFDVSHACAPGVE
jgi:hypothetical protein